MKNDRSLATFARLAGVLLALAAMTACGNLTAGGFGDVDVDISGDVDPSTTASFVAPRPLPTIAPFAIARSDHDDDDPEGDIEVEFELFLVSANGLTQQLGQELEVEMEVDGDSEADVIEATVPATLYTELQMLFTKIEAEIDSGLVVGGDTITGPVEVELDEPNLLVTRPIVLDVTDGASVELTIDMNSLAWLHAVDPTTNTVDESVFASLIGVVVR